MTHVEKLERFFTKREKQGAPVKPYEKGSMMRVAMRIDLLTQLHRPASECGLDLDTLIADAEARLRRPAPEKAEYAPPRPADHVTAFLVSPIPVVKEHCTTSRKKRKHVDAQAKATKKSWGKAGHALSNKIQRAAQERQKFQDDQDYAS